jgi:hypothetical protein
MRRVTDLAVLPAIMGVQNAMGGHRANGPAPAPKGSVSMQSDTNAPPPIDWPMWIRARRADIRSPERILSPPDREGYVYCPLCEQRVPGWNRDEHHRAHMADLDAWQANTPPEPTPSERRAERRRAQRWRERARAEEFEKDPYLYAVTGQRPANVPGRLRVAAGGILEARPKRAFGRSSSRAGCRPRSRASSGSRSTTRVGSSGRWNRRNEGSEIPKTGCFAAQPCGGFGS